MLGGVLNRLADAVRPKAPQVSRAPDGVRVYAIGDIHGRADLLDRLHERIEADAAACSAERRVIVHLGDYVDRGLDSKGVIDRLIAGPPEGFEAICLKGNHEDALLKFLDEPEFGGNWKYYGGLETMMSYGVRNLPLKDDPEAFRAARDEFVGLLPKSHLEFLQGLQLWVSFGDYFFAHAGVRPGVALENQAAEDLMWIRDEFLEADADLGKIVVHGHTPEEQPVEKRNRIGIDTGAYITGHLTALVLEGNKRRFLKTGG